MLSITKDFKNKFLLIAEERCFLIQWLINFFIVPFYWIFITVSGIIFLILETITFPFTFEYKKLYTKIYRKFYPLDIHKKIREYGKQLDADESYYLKKTVKEDYQLAKNKPLHKFIKEFIYTLRHEYYTVDLEGQLICGLSRRRSLGDIYLICKHYYPGIKIEDVLIELIKLIVYKEICAGWCNQTQKFMFHIDSWNYGLLSKVEYMENVTFKEIMKSYNY